MRIDHIAMYVKDLEKMKRFFVKYFGAVANEGYYNEKKEFRSCFLSFEEGGRLEIMFSPFVDCDELEQQRMGYIHIPLGLGSKEKVDEVTARLEQDGYAVLSGPRTTGDGYYESCVVGEEGNLVELTV